jgi:hypothetical protein
MEASSTTKTDESAHPNYSDAIGNKNPTSASLENFNIGNAAWRQQIDKEANCYQNRIASRNSSTNSLFQGIDSKRINELDKSLEGSIESDSINQKLSAKDIKAKEHSKSSSIASDSSGNALVGTTLLDDTFTLENYSWNAPVILNDNVPIDITFDDSNVNDLSNTQIQMMPIPFTATTQVSESEIVAGNTTAAARDTASNTNADVGSDHETFELLVKLYESWK